jgi:hypothetical protein
MDMPSWMNATTFRPVHSSVRFPEVKARYVTGLTTTPKRRDGQHPILEMQFGPPRYVVDQRSQSAAQSFQHLSLLSRNRTEGSRFHAAVPMGSS